MSGVSSIKVRADSITLHVGGNTVTINHTGVTINGMMIDVIGLAMLNMNAPMSTLSGDAMTVIEGGIVKVN